MEKLLKIVLVVGLGFLPNISWAVGSGSYHVEAGISVKELSHVGFAGVADTPAAIYYNPGGLTQVGGMQLQYGANVVNTDFEHTTPSGQTSSAKDESLPMPFLYASYSNADSPFAFGIGLNVPFGLRVDWSEAGFTKYWTTEAELAMYAVNPTVAYRINEAFSVGLGIDYFNVTNVELKQRVTFNPMLPDGFNKIQGDGDGWGYNLGVLWKPIENHSFGVSYRSQVNVGIDGDLEMTQIPGAVQGMLGVGSTFKTNATTDFKFPQSVLVGYGFKPTSRWTVFADYEFVDWKSTSETSFGYENNHPGLLGNLQSIPRDWKSTNNFGLGTEFDAQEWWSVRGGALVYEKVIPSKTQESSIPDSSRWGLVLGSGFHFGNTSLDVLAAALFYNDHSVTNSIGSAVGGNMNGEFESFISIFGLGLSHKWGN